MSSRRIAALVLPSLVHSWEGEELDARLLELAEVVCSRGVQVSISAPDTIWLDVTGVGRLHAQGDSEQDHPQQFGKGDDPEQVGEELLARELADSARAWGHRAQVVIASGPRVAQAIARYARLDASGIRIVSPGQTANAMADLPLLALLDIKRQVWFAQLGVLSVGDLLALPARSTSSRLGKDAPALLELARGYDAQPLVACEFPREIRLRTQWDDPSEGIEPLLFALRGLTSRLSARLTGRGEAVTQLSLEIEQDRAWCRHRGIPPKTLLNFELSSPIDKEIEIERVLRSRLERTTLPAPSIGIELCATGLCPQHSEQLELGTRGASQDLQQLPVLLAELEADVGPGNMGVLSCEDAHCPEDRSRLRPLSEVMGGAHRRSAAPRSAAPPSGAPPSAGARSAGARSAGARSAGARSAGARTTPADPLDRATRLLNTPVLLPVPLRVGESFALGSSFYTIERLYFAERLDLIKWWSSQSQSRDYLWAWLRTTSGGTEALLYVDRRTQKVFVQALSD